MTIYCGATDIPTGRHNPEVFSPEILGTISGSVPP